ncbi:helix-turn-helix transcriptional regulator [Paracoccus sp. SM22M-07]|uniref:helix-turn-helix domain-containing protein n=1 Tax=Paracoccus sp. SM22M-07 TaxID=1520813 RepID=UPI0009205AA1|nr:helix-turn-helix transcriptional regulator [Paracoccus sp. SM22M-07]OJH45168.1 hypothetical protein IE00_05750 [Paracoccus sp. SM22M-07]
MSRTFREALNERTGPGKASLKEVADKAGVSYEQLKKVRQGKSGSTNVEDALRVAAFFGLTLNEFLADDLAEDRAEIVQTYNALSEEERQILRDAARGRADRDHP